PRARLLGFDVMGGALDQHAPALAAGRVDLVDLERHQEVGAGDPGLQVLVQRAVPGGAEHHRPVVPPVVHRQNGRAEPALVSDAADPARRNQPQALGLVKLFDHAVSHGSTLASWAGAMTFNPDGMDLRPCRQLALLTRLVVEDNKPAEEAMRALVYHGPGQKAWEEVADPEILDDGDVIVRVDATTICGTDLHILKGDVPAVHEGRILGHEAVGTVWEAGDGVRRF